METGDERCTKFPSKMKYECSHCQGLERGTPDNPRFTLRESSFDGFPVVEVLKNGGPVHVWDEHFQFGERKAEILLACVDTLREFWLSTDDDKRTFATRRIENHGCGLVITIEVEMRHDFELSTGPKVDRPWLCLHALSPDNVRIGLGTLKCQAICAVEEGLRKWLLRQKIQRAEDLLEQLRDRRAK